MQGSRIAVQTPLCDHLFGDSMLINLPTKTVQEWNVVAAGNYHMRILFS
jgi:hypothetical protein